MKYIDEMMEKYGFGDGADVPQEAGELRMVYVSVVNALAIQIKSQFRMVAFDRPGMHNGCMVVFVDKDVLKKAIRNKKELDEVVNDAKPVSMNLDEVQYHETDDLFKDAFSEASDMDPPLEELIQVEVTIDEKELKATLDSIRKGELTCGNHQGSV